MYKLFDLIVERGMTDVECCTICFYEKIICCVSFCF